jgi:pimeloyl-ACP methyl ester carboxylesterase
MEQPLRSTDVCRLKFVELNATQDTTLLYIHGAFSSPAEIGLVVPYLSKYHLLIPSLFEEHEYTSQQPFSISGTCIQLHALISHHGKGGKAHVFSLSLGAHIALNLAKHFPSIVEDRSLIASGLTLFSHFPTWKQALVPYFLYMQSVLPSKILPRNLHIDLINRTIQPASHAFAAALVSHPSHQKDMLLCGQICNSMMMSLEKDSPIDVNVRTLIIAGTASGNGKFPDPLDDARFVIQELRKSNPESIAVQVKRGSHPWPLQVPDLCAAIVIAWIEGTELPDDAVPI